MSVNGTTGFTDLVGVGNGEICVGVGVGCATGVELLMVGVADPERGGVEPLWLLLPQPARIRFFRRLADVGDDRRSRSFPSKKRPTSSAFQRHTAGD
jgi:hypothetical protein